LNRLLNESSLFAAGELLEMGDTTPSIRREEHKRMAETYTCPMHPEVKQDKPGTCPKCGMSLEKKTKYS
jgi:hypothetical protein